MLAIVVLVDVFLTTLHPDVEGRIAATVQRTCWRTAVTAGRALSRMRRQLLALAGPVMVVATFALWVVLFVVAVALMVWPHLDGFRADPQLGVLTFIDALYFAGNTVTVLGYGDLTPLTPWAKTLSWLASGAGFGMLTAVVTYILELVSSIDQRNRMALKVHDDTGGTDRGVELVLRHLTMGAGACLHRRYEEWAELSRIVQDRLHRFALTSLYYRSRDPAYDPEGMLRVVGEAVAAGYLLTSDPRHAQLRPAVEHLDLAATRLMATVAEQYLGRGVMTAIEDPDVRDSDRRWVQAMHTEMQQGLGEHWGADTVDQPTLAIVARLRCFADALSDLTDWSPEHGPMPAGDTGTSAA